SVHPLALHSFPTRRSSDLKSTGESPHQFVLRHRIERAKQMLRAAEARILDVAIACGFKTQQHFARVFRRVCGTSPTEYRLDFQRSEEHTSELQSLAYLVCR